MDGKVPLKPVMHFIPDAQVAQVEVESDVLIAKRKLTLGAMECKTILTRVSNNFSAQKESIVVDAVSTSRVAQAVHGKQVNARVSLVAATYNKLENGEVSCESSMIPTTRFLLNLIKF